MKIIDTDFYNPVYLFRLMTGHSEFSLIIFNKKSNRNEMLVILLKLLNVIFYDDTIASHKEEIESKELENFVENVTRVYNGTMSDTDRLIYRILTLLHDNQYAPDMCSVQLNGSKAKNLTWIYNYLQPKDVYATLSDFPFQRAQIAPPFNFESVGAKHIHDTKLSDAKSLYAPSNFSEDEEEDEMDIDEEFQIYEHEFRILGRGTNRRRRQHHLKLNHTVMLIHALINSCDCWHT